MTDDELMEYLCLPDGPQERMFIANMELKRRDAYERMREMEVDIALWQAGWGPKPTGVILWHDHSQSSERPNE